MNIRRIISCILLCTLTAGAICIPNAIAADDEINYGEYLTCKKRDKDGDGIYDYVEITACDKTAVTVEIPSEIEGLSVEKIGANGSNGAFQGCDKLQSVTIPDTVSTISEKAFERCESLTSIAIPEGVTKINNRTFMQCFSLTDVTLPEGITSLGDNAFGACRVLEHITLPDSVTNIGSAFNLCFKLNEITLPSAVSSINSDAFYKCEALENIFVPEDNEKFCSIDGVLFDKNVSELVQYPIGRKTAEYVIPDTVTDIGAYSFNDCKKLTKVTIPDSVKEIGKFAFNDCISLKDAGIPDSVQYIEEQAFMGCSSLTSMTIPASVSKIGVQAFDYCTALKEMTILNPQCNISRLMAITLHDLTIYGYRDSTAQKYAENTEKKFIALDDDELIYGDANLDGKATMADATAILQHIGNNEKYGLTGQALINADCYNPGDGITGNDALAVQKCDAKLISELPEIE